MENLLARIERLEYHQQLLLKITQETGYEFDKLIIRKKLDKYEVEAFYTLCESMSIRMEEEKAEQFVFHAPLFSEFLHQLNSKLTIEEVIDACMKQKIYVELMQVLQKNL
ncbi:DUF1878 family protein [Lederbergia lenta]|uniref:YhaI n=1 Tax=Lederbergia lenta TaxID=1467 RepID=A0A2X4WD93_LEDLE|nr:DUF1878 family protein [Lederbergia lenta]MCM3110517.1 YhaI family protein [Lederbergia lenta]MEC2323917.1 DUF1878 family protein [Lederbergia lenta]SQI61023.1 YhaI [Lederbergia lenta]